MKNKIGNIDQRFFWTFSGVSKLTLLSELYICYMFIWTKLNQITADETQDPITGPRKSPRAPPSKKSSMRQCNCTLPAKTVPMKLAKIFAAKKCHRN